MKHYGGGGGSRQFLVHYKWVSQEMVHNNDRYLFPVHLRCFVLLLSKDSRKFLESFFFVKATLFKCFYFHFCILLHVFTSL